MNPSRPPRKRLGQHFLTDRRLAQRIVTELALQPEDRCVEIGPGRGELTQLLLTQVWHLDTIEFDRGLAQNLQAWAARTRRGTLEVHRQDVLETDFTALAQRRGGELRVVGNLPYNISTPLLFHLIKEREAIADMHFMLQREVAKRLVAAPGHHEYGRLSVMVQLDCEVTPLFHVPPGAFYPVPRVDSMVVRLRGRPSGTRQPHNREQFTELVRRAFQARRKMLRNALRGWCDPATMVAVGIRPEQRAEELRVEDYIRLADVLGQPGDARTAAGP